MGITISSSSPRSHCTELDDEKGDIRQVADWSREYADSLDPLSDLPEAIDEFVRPERRYGWLK